MANHRWLNAALAASALLAFLVLTFSNDSDDLGIEVESRDPSPGIDEIRVAVTGAVARPGVVTVRPGDRVADAIALAGGLTADGDMNAVNLARRVRDEDQVVVPRVGERFALLDLNRATAQELEALPGVGPTYANAIVQARTTHGPFESTDQLVELGLVPERVYERFRDLVTVH
ncbi:MAG: ComEA family DNA-binding protein [Dehalococcoidia bacterium]|nr:ComEA family DNA-binding protein [Dehalococcoidia bacterium]